MELGKISLKKLKSIDQFHGKNSEILEKLENGRIVCVFSDKLIVFFPFILSWIFPRFECFTFPLFRLKSWPLSSHLSSHLNWTSWKKSREWKRFMNEPMKWRPWILGRGIESKSNCLNKHIGICTLSGVPKDRCDDHRLPVVVGLTVFHWMRWSIFKAGAHLGDATRWELRPVIENSSLWWNF